MDLVAVLGALARRWYVLGVGFLVTAALCGYLLQHVAPEYQVGGSILLLPPQSETAKVLNPLLSLSGLEQPGTFLTAQLDTQQAREAFAARFPHAGLVVGLDPKIPGPVITVTITSSELDEARAANTYVLSELGSTLLRIQEQLGIPETAIVGSTVLKAETAPVVLRMRRNRALMAVLAAGGLVSIVGAVTTDALARQRRDGSARSSVGSPSRVPAQPNHVGCADREGADHHRAESGPHHGPTSVTHVGPDIRA
jgi:hypothetical protein